MSIVTGPKIQSDAIIAYVLRKECDEWKYLLLRRCGPHLTGNWQMVSGGLDHGESAWQGALREIHEETGLVPSRLYSADTLEIFYLAGHDQIRVHPAFVAFIDNDQQAVTLSQHEHDAFKWASYQDALKILEFSEQKRILAHIQNNFVIQQPSERFLIKNG